MNNMDVDKIDKLLEVEGFSDAEIIEIFNIGSIILIALKLNGIIPNRVSYRALYMLADNLRSDLNIKKETRN